MRVDILTIFPEMFSGPCGAGLLGRVQAKGLLTLACHNIRDYTTDKHRSVDDTPYGGGPGMVMRPEPVVAAIEAVAPAGSAAHRVLLCPQGRRLTTEVARTLAQRPHLVLVCPRYEGIDERVRQGWIDEEISLGDFIVSGGELPAMVLLDAIVRWLPEALGNPASLTEESFAQGTLEYPQYTRPAVFRGLPVPEVLQQGHHGEIEAWRRSQAQQRTLDRRPDLLEKRPLDTKLTKES